MEFAEGSFLQVIVAGRARILTGRIARVSVISGDPEMISGEVTLGEIRSITSGESLPDQLTVGFARYGRPEARIKSGGQGWNGVEITEGVYLILALARDHAPATATAVLQIQTPNDPFVGEVAWCVHAEQQQGTVQRLPLIRDSLLNGRGLVAAWGHYCAGRLKRIPRAEAVSLELELLNSQARDEHDRLTAAQNLELELWKGGDADDLPNRQIVRALVSNLTAASRALQSYLIEALHRILFSDAPAGKLAEAYRQSLRHAASIRSESAVIQALSSYRGDSATGRAADDLLRWIQK